MKIPGYDQLTLVCASRGDIYDYYVTVAKEVDLWCKFLHQELIASTSIPEEAIHWTIKFFKEKGTLPQFSFTQTELKTDPDLSSLDYMATGILSRLPLITFKEFYRIAQERYTKPNQEEVKDEPSITITSPKSF